jgi:hypothetical protein
MLSPPEVRGIVEIVATIVNNCRIALAPRLWTRIVGG